MQLCFVLFRAFFLDRFLYVAQASLGLTILLSQPRVLGLCICVAVSSYEALLFLLQTVLHSNVRFALTIPS